MESVSTPLNGNLSMDNACGTKHGLYKTTIILNAQITLGIYLGRSDIQVYELLTRYVGYLMPWGTE